MCDWPDVLELEGWSLYGLSIYIASLFGMRKTMSRLVVGWKTRFYPLHGSEEILD